MPRTTEVQELSADVRHREIAAILARGVVRLRRVNQTNEARVVQNPALCLGTGLELSGETRLSVPKRTRGLRLRDEGDNE